ncbi:MAG: molybdenum cofactor biosynthesis protein MoaE [Deltaproteobacteria bacterium]|nr:molybdenum cofactor biosynthesis protein MoaE [Deltaproteobacteria bacterium]
MIELTEKPIEVEKVLQSVFTKKAGGVVHFVGTVREEDGIEGLDYECHTPMAEKVIRNIIQLASKKWPLQKVSVAHRYGWIPLGEAAVIVAVSSAHRKEAFEACSYLIDRIKEEVPIWKSNRERVSAKSDLFRLAGRSER